MSRQHPERDPFAISMSQRKGTVTGAVMFSGTITSVALTAAHKSLDLEWWGVVVYIAPVFASILTFLVDPFIREITWSFWVWNWKRKKVRLLLLLDERIREIRLRKDNLNTDNKKLLRKYEDGLQELENERAEIACSLQLNHLNGASNASKKMKTVGEPRSARSDRH